MIFNFLSNPHPLHKAILRNDISTFKTLLEPYLLDEKDEHGLTPYLLAKFLDRKQFLLYLRSTYEEPIFKFDQNEKASIAELEKHFEFTYNDDLKFNEEKTLFSIIKRCKKNNIDKEHLWHGYYFEKEIKSGFTADVTIKWINPILEYGLFSNVFIKKGSYIGHYGGEVRKYQKEDAKNPYCFAYQISYDKDTPFTIDARPTGTLCRFINHSYKPNLMPRLAYCNNIMYVILIAHKDIQKGSELTFDYGPRYWERRETPVLI